MNFYKTINSLCKSKGISLSAMVKELGMSSSFPNKWLNGQLPNSKTLIELADFLDVTTDYLLEREPKKTPNVLNYGESATKYVIKELVDTILKNNDDEEILYALKIVLEKFAK